MNRLFTFGCSFTKYNWAMWPEIMKLEYKPDVFKNYGVCGAGNQYIAHQVAVANQEHKFTKDDLIMICWTHIFRKDWFRPTGYYDPNDIGQLGSPGHVNGWECNGNIYNSSYGLSLHMSDVIKIPADFLARDLLYITNTIELLEAKGIPNHQMQLLPLFSKFGDGEDEAFLADDLNHNDISTLSNYLKPFLKTSFEEIVNTHITWEEYFQHDENAGEYHPMPVDHAIYLEKVLDVKFSQSTMDAAKRCQDAVFTFFKTKRPLVIDKHPDYNVLFQDQNTMKPLDFALYLDKFS